MGLDLPAYGTDVAVTMTVGAQSAGGVTGPIEVTVRDQASPDAVAGATYCCVPADNPNAAWEVSVDLASQPIGALTVIASAGGTATAPEHFAVTGVWGQAH